MIPLEKLRNHIGELIHLKTELFWYDTIVWDGIEGRVCLLLDAQEFDPDPAEACTCGSSDATVLLFMDGSPKWVIICEDAVEFIQ
jgi:hypothetical protein